MQSKFVSALPQEGLGASFQNSPCSILGLLAKSPKPSNIHPCRWDSPCKFQSGVGAGSGWEPWEKRRSDDARTGGSPCRAKTRATFSSFSRRPRRWLCHGASASAADPSSLDLRFSKGSPDVPRSLKSFRHRTWLQGSLFLSSAGTFETVFRVAKSWHPIVLFRYSTALLVSR